MLRWPSRFWFWCTRAWQSMNWEPTYHVVVAPKLVPLQPLTMCTAIVNRPYREPGR